MSGALTGWRSSLGTSTRGQRCDQVFEGLVTNPHSRSGEFREPASGHDRRQAQYVCLNEETAFGSSESTMLLGNGLDGL